MNDFYSFFNDNYLIHCMEKEEKEDKQVGEECNYCFPCLECGNNQGCIKHSPLLTEWMSSINCISCSQIYMYYHSLKEGFHWEYNIGEQGERDHDPVNYMDIVFRLEFTENKNRYSYMYPYVCIIRFLRSVLNEYGIIELGNEDELINDDLENLLIFSMINRLQRCPMWVKDRILDGVDVKYFNPQMVEYVRKGDKVKSSRF